MMTTRNENWIKHLQQWQLFLEECLAQTDNIGDKIKLQRQRRIIEDVRFSAVLNPSLFVEFINPISLPNFDNNNLEYILELNESQKRAVSMALSNNVLSLIQGPPGTGKTQVITEICLQLFRSNPDIRILVCSETHIAVNNLISRLSQHTDDLRIVRIRDKEQDGTTDEFSPESIIRHYSNWLYDNIESRDLCDIITETLSDYEDVSLEKALTLSANVTGMTCNRVGAYNYSSTSEMFDVVIIDEVCKATLPEILMPLSVAKKAVLVGDPKQLPPVFCSEELEIIRSIENCNLQNYMYIDKLFEATKCVTQLDTQYRMSKRIASLISSLFYNNTLNSGKVDAQEGLIEWLDYKPSREWPLKAEEDKQRIFNTDECEIISNLLTDLDTDANNAMSIAIIAPYRQQVNALRQKVGELYLDYIDVIVDTVDGFQGKECDIVIFSLTRTHGSYRFLADKRRLNVALSRAREQIYMIGSLKFAENNKLLSEIASRSEKKVVNVGSAISEEIYNV